MTDLAHHLMEAWPEVLGGFIGYCAHTVKHRLYHIVIHTLRRQHAR